MAKACRSQGGGAARRAVEAASDGIYTPPLPEEMRVNPIRSQADWQAMREACENDPGAFHGAIAARTLHWYHPELEARLTREEDGNWRGWRVADARRRERFF